MSEQNEQPDESSPLEHAKSMADLVGQLIDKSGSTEAGKKATANLGRTAVTLTQAINVLLLPVEAVVKVTEKAQQYFAERFQNELKDKVANIPPESIVEPKPSIARPALEGLAQSLDEPELKEFFLNLIAGSLDGRRDTHPAFSHILQQLTPSEAKVLRYLSNDYGPTPIIDVVYDGSLVVLRNYGDFIAAGSTEGTNFEHEVALSNLRRLNLAQTRRATAPEVFPAHDLLLESIKPAMIKNGFDKEKLSAIPKVIALTPLGARLVGACVKEEYATLPLIIFQER